MQGMALCRRFYEECVRGFIGEAFPHLRYSAGLLGAGSEVLGYDDEVSQDHMWGPRLLIFLSEEDHSRAEALLSALTAGLPRRFLGYSVGFGAPDAEGISSMDAEAAVFRPMIYVQTFAAFLQSYLGVSSPEGLAAADWLAFSEHKLLTLQAGRLFRDDLGLAAQLAALRYYPREVWLYLLYSDWSCLAEERAFVKRAASLDDDLGSRLVCARLAQRVMHLCFLYERRYAPYAKWFGRAFGELACAAGIAPLLREALGADDPLERERAIARAQAALIDLNNRSGLTEPISTQTHPYFSRDILVADADLVCAALARRLAGSALAALPPVGSLSAVGNLVVLAESAENLPRLKKLYE